MDEQTSPAPNQAHASAVDRQAPEASSQARTSVLDRQAAVAPGAQQLSTCRASGGSAQAQQQQSRSGAAVCSAQLQAGDRGASSTRQSCYAIGTAPAAPPPRASTPGPAPRPPRSIRPRPSADQRSLTENGAEGQSCKGLEPSRGLVPLISNRTGRSADLRSSAKPRTEPSLVQSRTEPGTEPSLVQSRTEPGTEPSLVQSRTEPGVRSICTHSRAESGTERLSQSGTERLSQSGAAPAPGQLLCSTGPLAHRQGNAEWRGNADTAEPSALHSTAEASELWHPQGAGAGAQPWQHLPLDVLLDVLHKLPPKDVLSCRAVCRSWHAAASDAALWAAFLAALTGSHTAAARSSTDGARSSTTACTTRKSGALAVEQVARSAAGGGLAGVRALRRQSREPQSDPQASTTSAAGAVAAYAAAWHLEQNWRLGRYSETLSFGHDRYVERLEFLERGGGAHRQVLVSAGADGSLRSVCPRTGTLVCAGTGHRQWITNMLTTESTVVTGSLDRTVCVWQTLHRASASPRQPCRRMELQSEVSALAWVLAGVLCHFANVTAMTGNTGSHVLGGESTQATHNRCSATRTLHSQSQIGGAANSSLAMRESQGVQQRASAAQATRLCLDIMPRPHLLPLLEVWQGLLEV